MSQNKYLTRYASYVSFKPIMTKCKNMHEWHNNNNEQYRKQEKFGELENVKNGRNLYAHIFEKWPVLLVSM